MVAAGSHLVLQCTHKGAASHGLLGEVTDLVEQDLTMYHQEPLNTVSLQAEEGPESKDMC